MSMNHDVYGTADLGEIVYLMTKGVPLSRTEREGQRVVFFFAGEDTCRQLVTDLGYGRDLVRLTTALQEIRRARHIMHHV